MRNDTIKRGREKKAIKITHTCDNKGGARR